MEFTAVYNTEAMKCIDYRFKADSIEQAKAFCRYKFSVKDIVIINHDNETFPIHLGDARKTSAIYRAYIKKTSVTMNREKERQRIGSRIAELRKTVEWTDAAGIRRTGMTQTDLAQITGLTRTHILRIEQGKYSVGLDYLAAIAEALGCEIDFIHK